MAIQWKEVWQLIAMLYSLAQMVNRDEVREKWKAKWGEFRDECTSDPDLGPIVMQIQAIWNEVED